MAEEVRLKVTYFYYCIWFCVFLVLGFTIGTFYVPVINVVTPSNCDLSITPYGNVTDFGPLDILLDKSCWKNSRICKQNGESESCRYSDCLDPYSSSFWSELDDKNKVNSYSTNFASAVRRFLFASSMSIAFRVLGFVLSIGLAIIIFRKLLPLQQLPYAIIFTFFTPIIGVLYLIIFFLISGTSLSNSHAWEAYFFLTCSVSVEKSPVYIYAIIVFVALLLCLFFGLTQLLLLKREAKSLEIPYFELLIQKSIPVSSPVSAPASGHEIQIAPLPTNQYSQPPGQYGQPTGQYGQPIVQYSQAPV